MCGLHYPITIFPNNFMIFEHLELHTLITLNHLTFI
jgi:hypothetical protein